MSTLLRAIVGLHPCALGEMVYVRGLAIPNRRIFDSKIYYRHQYDRRL
jgi:hypothetical protein